jgi:CheY-like chemotaxis protein
MPFEATMPRVLVVDDEPFVVELVGRMLRRVCVVEGAPDGATALARLRGSPTKYALILSDLSMPHLDGLGLLDALRAELPAMAERFAIVTGGAQNPRDDLRLGRAGVPVVWKPFKGIELIALVRGYLPGDTAAVPDRPRRQTSDTAG